MEQTLFTVEGYDYQFRLGKMSALDVLAFRTQIKFEDLDSARNVFGIILEKIEVQVGNQWLPCKTKGMDVFYPAELEENIDLLNKLVGYFLNDFLKPVFRKSNESN